MTSRSNEAISTVVRLCAELVDAAATEQVRAKLNNLQEVCHLIVVEASQRPTIPEVARRYKARFPFAEHSLAEQSIRNKRGGSNPYARLYAAWQGAAEIILATPHRTRHSIRPTKILSTDDIAGIKDIALRHQVGLVLAQNRSLKSQLDILKTVRSAPVLRVAGAGSANGPASLSKHHALSESDVEAVRNFIDGRRMRARGLRCAEDGAIEMIDGRRLSDPGFVEALNKILEIH